MNVYVLYSLFDLLCVVSVPSLCIVVLYSSRWTVGRVGRATAWAKCIRRRNDTGGINVDAWENSDWLSGRQAVTNILYMGVGDKRRAR